MKAAVVTGILDFFADFDVLVVLACLYIFSIAGYAIVVSYLDAPDRKRTSHKPR